jgi:uncharacterized repeat protein (TIGR03803 family)
MTLKIHLQVPRKPKPSRPNHRTHWLLRAIASLLLVTVFPILALHFPAEAQSSTDNVIYSFTGGADGNEPLFSGVVRDRAGNFYGTTYAGGAFNYGTVFKVDASGKETVLHSFGGKHDGRSPYAGVVIGPAGRLFGTTYQGGLPNPQCQQGCGIVFEIKHNGEEKVLHRFTGGMDGGLPFGGLIRAPDGTLYGTTEIGGAFGVGTIFKVDTSGAETVLYSFAGQPDAQYPESGLIRDEAGNFYGTTAAGGVSGLGTVFEFDTSGHETLLYSFGGMFNSDGQNPDAALFRSPTGDLYGTTYLGGTENIGTVFKIDASGHETVLHSFGDAQNDGAYAESSLVSDSRGNLYGTTIQGGIFGIPGGIVFRISAEGAYSVVYSFGGKLDGSAPAGPLLRGPNGSFFGTTTSGGKIGAGTVYQFIP